jgi:hypothetical protein
VKKSRFTEAQIVGILKELEAEHTQMQRIIARQTLEIDAMRNLIAKNGWGPQRGKTR